MATNFPNSLDDLSNPQGTDSLQGHAQLHTNVNDAIEALQEKVGIDGSTDANSLDYRVTALETAPPSTESKIIYQIVKNATGSTLQKAKAVYISGAVGASGHMEVSLASNSGENSSSKTFGLLRNNILNGETGEVVTEGLLQGVNTVGASDGDPVWLGTNGSLIFGLANKPSAPAHLVFLGIVIHGGQANTGVIFVKVQNGFELEELHNVSITNPQNGNILQYNSSTGLWVNVNLDLEYVKEEELQEVVDKLGLDGNNSLIVTGIENKTTIDSFSKTEYRTVKYVLQISKGQEYVSSELTILNDGTNINISESNIVSNTQNSLANIDFEENAGIISLTVTPVSSEVTARYYRTALKL